jgi:hypothetical protein
VDNTHELRDSQFSPTSFGMVSGAIPVEDGEDALAVALWLETDRNYKYATQRLEAVKTSGSLRNSLLPVISPLCTRALSFPPLA